MVKADKTGKFAGHRLPARQVCDAGPQPQLDRVDGLPSAHTWTDQRQRRRRRDRRRPTGARRARNAIQLDTPSQPIVKLGYQTYQSSSRSRPGSGDHYIGAQQRGTPRSTTSTCAGPSAAELDRAAIVKARGGPLVGTAGDALHLPGVAGLRAGRRLSGSQTDFNKNVNGNLAVATKYMKAAGYQQRQVHRQRTGADRRDQQRQRPGDHADRQHDLPARASRPTSALVDQSVMYSKFCGVPKAGDRRLPDRRLDPGLRRPADACCSRRSTARRSCRPTTPTGARSTTRRSTRRWTRPRRSPTRPPAPRHGPTSTRCSSTRPPAFRRSVRQPAQHREPRTSHGVNQLWNERTWDLHFSSLK